MRLRLHGIPHNRCRHIHASNSVHAAASRKQILLFHLVYFLTKNRFVRMLMTVLSVLSVVFSQGKSKSENVVESKKFGEVAIPKRTKIVLQFVRTSPSKSYRSVGTQTEHKLLDFATYLDKQAEMDYSDSDSEYDIDDELVVKIITSVSHKKP